MCVNTDELCSLYRSHMRQNKFSLFAASAFSKWSLSDVDQEYRRQFPDNVCFTPQDDIMCVFLPHRIYCMVNESVLPVRTQVAIVSRHFAISLDTTKQCCVFSKLLEEAGFGCKVTKLVTIHRSR